MAPEALPRWLDRRGNELDTIIHMGANIVTRYLVQSYLSSENQYR
jgi:hypothetical protein